MRTEGLKLDTAPPVSIALPFFLTAPLALALAGVGLMWFGPLAFLSGWGSVTVSITHLCTLGFIAMALMGAFYQMSFVVAHSSVPWLRSAHFVHVGFSAGILGLCWGTAYSAGNAVFWAISILFLALLLFVVQIAVALRRSPERNATLRGMRLALGCFMAAVFLGVWIAHGYSGMQFPGPRQLWLQVHLSVALLGFVGGAIIAVSWRLLPMFQDSARVGEGLRRAVHWMLLVGVVAPVGLLINDYFGGTLGSVLRPEQGAALATLPAVVAIWGLHPLASLQRLSARGSGRPAAAAGVVPAGRTAGDGSLLFWRAGLMVAPLCGLSAGLAFLGDDPRFGLLFGWLAVWGWAGMIVHGMLTRIVPFVVLSDRLASASGAVAPVTTHGPPADRGLNVSFWLHVVTLVVGLGALWLGWAWLSRAVGALMLATALAMTHLMVQAIRTQSPE